MPPGKCFLIARSRLPARSPYRVLRLTRLLRSTPTSFARPCLNRMDAALSVQKYVTPRLPRKLWEGAPHNPRASEKVVPIDTPSIARREIALVGEPAADTADSAQSATIVAIAAVTGARLRIPSPSIVGASLC